jgi:hypothetical protein
MHCSKQRLYSITRSARNKVVGEMLTPSAAAVFRFSTNSNLVGVSIGSSRRSIDAG